MGEMTGEGATGQLLSSYSRVSLRPSIQLPRNGKRFTYKWEGWGTKHPQTQPLAPPHSFQNFSCLLTHRQKQQGTPSILSPPPFPPGGCSEVLPSYYPLPRPPLLPGLINRSCPWGTNIDCARTPCKEAMPPQPPLANQGYTGRCHHMHQELSPHLSI